MIQMAPVAIGAHGRRVVEDESGPRVHVNGEPLLTCTLCPRPFIPEPRTKEPSIRGEQWDTLKKCCQRKSRGRCRRARKRKAIIGGALTGALKVAGIGGLGANRVFFALHDA
jgi:hypothetical protein